MARNASPRAGRWTPAMTPIARTRALDRCIVRAMAIAIAMATIRHAPATPRQPLLPASTCAPCRVDGACRSSRRADVPKGARLGRAGDLHALWQHRLERDRRTCRRETSTAARWLEPCNTAPGLRRSGGSNAVDEARTRACLDLAHCRTWPARADRPLNPALPFACQRPSLRSQYICNSARAAQTSAIRPTYSTFCDPPVSVGAYFRGTPAFRCVKASPEMRLLTSMHRELRLVTAVMDETEIS